MGPVGWTLIVVGLIVLFLMVQAVHLSTVLRWEDEQTRGLGYYGKSPAEREAFKHRLRGQVRLLSPILFLTSRGARLDFRKASFQYRGVSGPLGTTTPASFEKAAAYHPRPDDVFVVTQMKCGTTWMQHVVYQVLHRGAGTLVESGGTLYGVCPWLEGIRSVPIEEAKPLGSERPARIIKTHLPASLCPTSTDARYIYVARHPVSCFASCVDFVATNVGRQAPSLEVFADWFTSKDLMWWGTWTDHVRGWWERNHASTNVLWIQFETMKRDLPGVVRQVAEFLGIRPLSDGELAAVVEKCGFDYMQRHQGTFEMHPPHILQTNAELFVRGSADRYKDVPQALQDRIRQWARGELNGSSVPLDQWYPDVR
jgi:Sulfotransferase domain